MRHFGATGVVIAALAALPAWASEIQPLACPVEPAPPAAEVQASHLVQQIQADAVEAQQAADRLDTLVRDGSDVDFRSHARYLEAVRDEVNDMGQRLCQLEKMRPAEARWEQKAIRQTGSVLPLLADNVADAVTFLNQHQDALWEPGYGRYVDNLYVQSKHLARALARLEGRA